MKKRSLILLISALLILVLTACGGKGSSGSTPAEEPAEPELTVETYFNAHAGELEEMKEQLNQNEDLKDTMTVDVYAEGNTICYIYTLKQTLSQEDMDAAKPKLQEYIDTNQDGLKEQIASMEEGLGIEGIKLYFEYRNGDGTEIFNGTVE